MTEVGDGLGSPITDQLYEEYPVVSVPSPPFLASWNLQHGNTVSSLWISR